MSFREILNKKKVGEHRFNVPLYYCIIDVIVLDVFKISLNSNIIYGITIRYHILKYINA